MGAKKSPMCRVCGWRKGGFDSWNGYACACGLSDPKPTVCTRCHGYGKVPYNIGYQPCSGCKGTGRPRAEAA